MSSEGKAQILPGDEFCGPTKVITQEAIDRFEYVGQGAAGQDGMGPPPVNIHTDDARAREMGLTRRWRRGRCLSPSSMNCWRGGSGLTSGRAGTWR